MRFVAEYNYIWTDTFKEDNPLQLLSGNSVQTALMNQSQV